jgi:[ribosomal protein S5]-alanine N-acetyltransferase
MSTPVPECTRIRLDGDSYSLRTMSVEDASERYVAWLNDPLVTRHLETRFQVHSKEDVRRYIKGFDNVGKYLFGIHALADGEHIGTCTLNKIDLNHGTAHYGIMVGDRDYWGRGVVMEAVPLLLDFAFDELELRKITAGTYANNIATVINLKKLGLTQEGRLRAQLRDGDEYVDEIRFGILKSEWQTRRA